MTQPGDHEFLRSIFLMEAWDTLVAIEEGVARLGAAEATPGSCDALFVVTHRLKGAAGLHGFRTIADLADRMEQALAPLPGARPGVIRATAMHLEGLAADLKRSLERLERTGSEAADAPTVAAAPPGDPVRAEMEAFFREQADVAAYFAPEASEHLDVISGALLALERGGARGEELAGLFRAVHTLKGSAYVVGCARMGDVAHRLEDLLVAFREAEVGLTPAVLETAHDAVDAVKLMLDIARDPARDLTAHVADVVARIGALLAAPVPEPMPADAAAPVLAEAPPPEALRSPAPAPVVAPSRVAPPHVVPAARPAPSRPLPSRQTIRVSLERIDALMDLVGELVVARTRLEQRLVELDRVSGTLSSSRLRMRDTFTDFERRHSDAQDEPADVVSDEPDDAATRGLASAAELFAELEFDRYDDTDLLARSVGEISSDVSEVHADLAGLARAVRDDLAQLHRITTALRRSIGRARLVPIGTLFTRFVREGQETARAAGTTVRIETSGESVELDTSVIEQIVDPLVHLVRNAVAHGIETADERRARGKPPTGLVTLSACHHGGAVFVEVHDDGRGIDADLLRRRAVVQGFLREEGAAAVDDREALELIFQPGFSTAPTVTAAAGRGIGMDVVRANVGRLGGEVDVQTEVGAGTRFTLKLPLTLLVSEGLLVRAGGETLALPLTSVQQIVTVPAAAVQGGPEGETVVLGDRSLDVLRLDASLGLPLGPGAARRPLVVLRAAGRPVALGVDEVLQREEIVIKGLGPFLEGVGPFGGATIAADGRVTLLLDPLRIAQRAAGRVVTQAPDAVAPRPVAGGRRVLLVDDSISVRKFVGRMLVKAGFGVTTANDGAEALRHLAEGPFEVVITDLEMPRVNGYELIEDLRRRPAMRAVPVVVLTTRAGDKHVSLARRLGVMHYVTKPVDEQAFVRLIESLVTPAHGSGLAEVAR